MTHHETYTEEKETDDKRRGANKEESRTNSVTRFTSECMDTHTRNDEENKKEMTSIYISNTHLTAEKEKKKQKIGKMART
jgi:hypothetical protein